VTRRAVITKDAGLSVYWVEFLEDGGPRLPRVPYMARWTARRAARRWVAGKLRPYREEIR
jgi:hypothetical protein